MLQRTYTDQQRIHYYMEAFNRKLQPAGITEVMQLRHTAAQILAKIQHAHRGPSVVTDLRQVTYIHFHVAAFTRSIQPLHINIQRPAR